MCQLKAHSSQKFLETAGFLAAYSNIFIQHIEIV